MLNQFSRTELIYGPEEIENVYKARVAVFGIGGVGGYVVEALARTGVGTIDIIDDDRICMTNINRQLYATFATIGQYKVDVCEERCKQINPKIVINKYKTFYLPETQDQFDFTQYDYVVDCIDTVSGKISLVLQAQEAGVPIISCMGAGNKVDPSQLKVADIYKTSMDPLAKTMRYELRRRGVKKLKVVYSTEKPVKPRDDLEISCRTHCICPPGTVRKCTVRRDIPGSTAFVPPAAGLLIASEIVKDLTGHKPLK